jgi:sodium transport system permease protein
MAIMLTGRPLKTLLLDRMPSVATCGVAILLAVCLQPFGVLLLELISSLYPLQDQLTNKLGSFQSLLEMAPYPWMPYVMLAVLPAFCEELAFRGFVLSGLRHLGSKRWAIGLAAVFFGLAHGIIQQSISATALGIVIGYIAVQTGSLVPGMLFHFTYNFLMYGGQNIFAKLVHFWPKLSILFHEAASRIVEKPEVGIVESPRVFLYNWPVMAVCAVGAIALLAWLHRLPYQATREEQIGDARARQPHHPLAASTPTGTE